MTRVIEIDAERPDPDVVAEAAAVIARGGLVAFPTETVYGLGVNALDASAVARLSGQGAARDRPVDRPPRAHRSAVPCGA